MPIYKTEKGYIVKVNYTDSFGNHKQILRQNKDTATLKGAKQVEADIISNISIYKESNVKTFNDLFKVYKKVKKSEIRASTLQQNARRLEMYIMPFFGNRKINDLNVSDYQYWKDEIDKLEVSTAYKNKIYKVLNELINFGIRYDYVKSNELKKVGRFKKPGEIVESKIDFWTKEEFDKFIEYGRCDCLFNEGNENEFIKWGYYVFYNIMFYCGCRKSEVYPLTWRDYKDGVISITKGLVYKVKGEEYVISAPKTKDSIRDLPVPKQLIEVLEEHYKRCQSIYGFNDDFYICGGVEPLRDTMLDNIKNEWADGAGVKRIRIYDLRHSHASLLVNNGANILAVKKRMGHKSIEMTLNVYSHLYKKTEDEAVETINNLD